MCNLFWLLVLRRVLWGNPCGTCQQPCSKGQACSCVLVFCQWHASPSLGTVNVARAVDSSRIAPFSGCLLVTFPTGSARRVMRAFNFSRVHDHVFLATRFPPNSLVDPRRPSTAFMFSTSSMYCCIYRHVLVSLSCGEVRAKEPGTSQCSWDFFSSFCCLEMGFVVVFFCLISRASCNDYHTILKTGLLSGFPQEIGCPAHRIFRMRM